MTAAVRPLPKRKPTAPTGRAKDVKSYTRSKISNHADLLPGVKGTSSQARRFKDLVNRYIADMGGLDMCSTERIEQARRLAANTVLHDDIATDIINGEKVDIPNLCTLDNTASKLTAQLGLLERRARDITPTLSDLLRADQEHQRQRHAEQQDAPLVEGDTS